MGYVVVVITLGLLYVYGFTLNAMTSTVAWPLVIISGPSTVWLAWRLSSDKSRNNFYVHCQYWWTHYRTRLAAGAAVLVILVLIAR